MDLRFAPGLPPGWYLGDEVHEAAQLLVIGLILSNPSTTKVDYRPGKHAKSLGLGDASFALRNLLVRTAALSVLFF